MFRHSVTLFWKQRVDSKSMQGCEFKASVRICGISTAKNYQNVKNMFFSLSFILLCDIEIFWKFHQTYLLLAIDKLNLRPCGYLSMP